MLAGQQWGNTTTKSLGSLNMYSALATTVHRPHWSYGDCKADIGTQEDIISMHTYSTVTTLTQE